MMQRGWFWGGTALIIHSLFQLAALERKLALTRAPDPIRPTAYF